MISIWRSDETIARFIASFWLSREIRALLGMELPLSSPRIRDLGKESMLWRFVEDGIEARTPFTRRRIEVKAEKEESKPK
jgi:hypothetical protein